MPSTPTYGLTYPDYADDPDGPAQIQQLAEDTEAALDGKADTAHTHALADVTDLVSELDGKADTGHGHSTLPNMKPRLAATTASFDADGVATITHSLGAVPVGGFFTALSSALTGNTGVGSFRFITGVATTTTFKVRAFAPDGTPLNTTLTFAYLIF